MPNIARFDEWREKGFASITSSYTAMGLSTSPSTAAPFTHAMRIIHFINGTNGDVAVSFDGFTNNIPIPAGAFSLYDVTSDEDAGEGVRYQNGTQLYVKYLTAPTSGTFYAVTFFVRGE